MALEAIARLGRRDLVYLLVGEVPPESDLLPLARELGVEDQLRFVPWVDLEKMNDYLAAVDAVVNLRHPNMGETSGVVCRSLAAGKPCIVSEGGWFSELPGDCVVRLPVGELEADRLAEALDRLLRDERHRTAIGAAGKLFSERHHDLNEVSRAYLELAAEVSESGATLAANHVADVGRELAQLGLTEDDDPLLDTVAATLDEVLDSEPSPKSPSPKSL